MMPQSAFAMTADAPSLSDCECCDDAGIIELSACEMFCAGMAVSLPEDEDSDVTASAVPFAQAARREAGISPAPDLSPPRPPVLT